MPVKIRGRVWSNQGEPLKHDAGLTPMKGGKRLEEEEPLTAASFWENLRQVVGKSLSQNGPLAGSGVWHKQSRSSVPSGLRFLPLWPPTHSSSSYNSYASPKIPAGALSTSSLGPSLLAFCFLQVLASFISPFSSASSTLPARGNSRTAKQHSGGRSNMGNEGKASWCRHAK